MGQQGLEQKDVAKHILIINSHKRTLAPRVFEVLAAATMARQRIKISHLNRQTSQTVEREVSPQRLVHYNDNWYLDAWCHLRDGLRSFSVDAIEKMTVMDEAAIEVPPENITAVMSAGYGIFGGTNTQWAKLKFSPKRSQWVSREVWHPEQQSTTEADGSFVLSIPYSDDRELVGDILRFGPEVEVLSPPALKASVQKMLLAAIGRYV
jgi:predicted DNA-binding transcriptional regulator YafY